MSTSVSNDELDRFRRDTVAWIEAHAPRGLYGTATTPFQGYWGGTRSGFPSDDYRVWFEAALARGWTAPAWPRAYGGGGLSTGEYNVFREELLARKLPLPLVGLGIAMIGPILLSRASADLQAIHVPRIVRGEVRWCQGYSEPGAGSDLASLTTKAVRDGEDFVINGQKIWTSHADISDWIFCLVRTSTEGKKQAGITFLLIDMQSPGITTRPITLISGASPFCEVFFEDVRVPVSQVVGEINAGWGVAKALLAHERGTVGESIAAGGARLEDLEGYTVRGHAIDTVGLDEHGALDDPILRDRLARSEMEQEAMRLMVRRYNDTLRAGGQPGPESSLFKLVGSELNQRRWELAADIAGLDGLFWSEGPISIGSLARQWLRSRGNTIEGGSSEIQRNIVARHVLGLPKSS